MIASQQSLLLAQTLFLPYPVLRGVSSPSGGTFRDVGAVDLSDATGADNEQIDVDLAREYAATHEAP